MAQEDPNRFTEWLWLIRKNWPVAREHFDEWVDAVREEPILLWETKAIRYSVYGMGFIFVIWLAVLGVEMITPPLPDDAKPAAVTADFHVVCRDLECNLHFVIHREMNYKKFPIDCPQCQRNTGEKAWRCNSADCAGRWVAPYKQDGGLYCPECGKEFH